MPIYAEYLASYWAKQKYLVMGKDTEKRDGKAYLRHSDFLDSGQSGLTAGCETEFVLVELLNNLLLAIGRDVSIQILLLLSAVLDIVANEVL